MSIVSNTPVLPSILGTVIVRNTVGTAPRGIERIGNGRESAHGHARIKAIFVLHATRFQARSLVGGTNSRYTPCLLPKFGAIIVVSTTGITFRFIKGNIINVKIGEASRVGGI